MNYMVLAGIDNVTFALQIIFGLLIVGGLVGMLVAKIIEKAGGGNGAGLKSKKTTSNKLQDSRAFINQFDDIRDGIIICDNFTRFISILSCNGYDYYTDSLAGKESCVRNYIRFWATVKEPVTYRTSSKKVDADKPKQKYQQRIDELSALILEKQSQLDSTSQNNPSYEILKREVANLNDTIRHLDHQLQCINHFSSSEVISDTQQCYVFEWKFNPKDYSFKMTNDELFVQAKTELNAKANDMLAQLNACHVTARVLNQAEVIDLFRHVSRPFTAEHFTMKQIDDSSYFYDIQSSHSYSSLYSEYAEEVIAQEEQAYYEKRAEIEEKLATLEKEKEKSNAVNDGKKNGETSSQKSNLEKNSSSTTANKSDNDEVILFESNHSTSSTTNDDVRLI